jgi:hypothetical protein
MCSFKKIPQSDLRSNFNSADLRGGIPDNVYNKDVLPRWRERFGGASVSER